jgi:hypothetical protein
VGYVFLSEKLEPEKKSGGKRVGKKLFVLGLIVILVSTYLQYVIAGLNLASGTLLVYGVPILVVSLIMGRRIVSKALNRTYYALKYGLGYFGVLTLIGFLAGNVILLILTFSILRRSIFCISLILFCRFLRN